MNNKTQRPFFLWLVEHPWLVLAASILVIAIAASGGRFLSFTTDYRVFFSKDNPQLLAFDQLERRFTKNDNVLFLLAPKDGNVFTPQTLNAVRELTDQAWQMPFSIRVDSISSFQYSHAEGEDDLIVEDLIGEDTELTPAAISRIRSVALKEPLLVDRVVSPQGHVTGVNVTIQFPDQKSLSDVPKVVDKAKELVKLFETNNPQIKVYLSGMVLMDNAFSEASQLDMQTLVPLSFIVIVISLGLLLKGWSSTFASFWVIMLSIAGAMGVAGWLRIGITPPSASAPTIILTLAVANAVHVLVTMFHGMRHGEDKRAAILESLRVNLQPVFLTSITTAVGFMSMNFSDAPPFRDLGNIVAMGVGLAFILSMTFLPALMQILPVKVPAKKQHKQSAMEKLAEFIIARRNQLFVSMSVVILLLIAFIPRNELNDQFVHYFDERISFRTDSDFVSDNLGGLYRIDYALEAKNAGGISDPGYLEKVESFAQWYRTQAGVVHVNAFTDIIKRLNKNMHGDDQSYYRIPQQRNLTAQYILLYEMSLPKGLDLNDQVNVDKSAIRFGVTTENLSTQQLLALEAKAQAWLQENAPSIRSDGTGTSMMFAHISRRNIQSMLIGASVALVIISMILVFALRSIKIGAVSLLPNLVPAAMAFGLWGLLVGEVGLGLSVVVGMTLGIVVDDSVHFLSKYLRARRELGKNAQDAVRYAFATVGTALWVTSLVLVAGFLVLALSSFKLNSGMGLLTAITIVFALLADFLFLPPLLMKVDGKSEVKDVDRDLISDQTVRAAEAG